jgi:copper chaperone CopZ
VIYRVYNITLPFKIILVKKENSKMKKKFKMQDIDCANCAAKMEAAIKKIDGVNDASISFMAQKLSIDADDERFDDIMQQAQKVVQSIEPDTSIVL